MTARQVMQTHFAFIKFLHMSLSNVPTLIQMFHCADIVLTPALVRTFTPLPGHLSNQSRPGTPQSGECNGL